jgi:hypothetical protein
MRRHQRQHVVEVERVAKRPVNECGEFWRCSLATAEDGTGTALAAVRDIAQEGRCDLAASASQDDGAGVGNRLFRRVERLRRHVSEGRVAKECGKCRGQSSHGDSLSKTA